MMFVRLVYGWDFRFDRWESEKKERRVISMLRACVSKAQLNERFFRGRKKHIWRLMFDNKVVNFGKNAVGNSVFFPRESQTLVSYWKSEFEFKTNDFVQNCSVFEFWLENSVEIQRKSARAHLIDCVKERAGAICIYFSIFFSWKPILHPNKTAFFYVHQALLLSITWQMYFEQKKSSKEFGWKKCSDFRCVHGIFYNRNDVLKR